MDQNKEYLAKRSRIYRRSHPEFNEKFISYIDNKLERSFYFMEYYGDNVILAELDIQCIYRTKLERGVIE